MAVATESDGATAQLARFIHGACFADLTPSTRHAARRALVNIVGCFVGGARHEIVQIAANALLPLGGSETSSLLGRSERTDILTAALLNTLSSAAYSFDDTHAEAIVHPSGAVAATLLALAEQRPMSGEAFLLAFVLGVDVAVRLSKAISLDPAEGDIGWSQTGITAGVGAAAAAAKALHLDSRAIGWSIGIAALQASGFRAAHGTMSSTMIFGHAAHSGLRAALLAQTGLDAPIAPLEGRYGFLSLFACRPHLPYLGDALGSRFEIEALAYKPYPCGIVIHPSLDAAIEWYREYGQHYESIRSVHLRTNPSAMALGYRRHPNGVLEAKVSLYHWVAAALTFGRAGIVEGQQAAIDERRVVRLRDVIEVETDSDVAPDAALLTLTLDSGDQQTIKTEHARGSVANPMSDADLGEKFAGQAQMQLTPERTAELLAACWNIDRLADVAEIAQLARVA